MGAHLWARVKDEVRKVIVIRALRRPVFYQLVCVIVLQIGVPSAVQ